MGPYGSDDELRIFCDGKVSREGCTEKQAAEHFEFAKGREKAIFIVGQSFLPSQGESCLSCSAANRTTQPEPWSHRSPRYTSGYTPPTWSQQK